MTPEQARQLADLEAVLWKGGAGTPHAQTIAQRLVRLEKIVTDLEAVVWKGGPGTPHDLTIGQRLARVEAATKEQP